MLFTSGQFIFGYLPIVLVVFFLIGKLNRIAAAAFLTLASLFFYGYWDKKYLVLLLVSISMNYGLGYCLQTSSGQGVKKLVLALGVGANLLLLGYFKYTNFVVANFSALTGIEFAVNQIVLPLGISFFTFTQIAFLVDAHRGEAREYNPVHYALFVTYFPHLIAGPILHHKQMMPQFGEAKTYSPVLENFVVGLTIFLIGLFKKLVLADEIAPQASAVFEAAASGKPLGFLEAWIGALSYTLQLYFDFSGYSDMAIGLSRLFGIQLPINFNSPYKATNITDFWRRWHITLSTFLRDYLYIPLGGSRRGPFRRYLNLFLTMLLGGIWHGAGWTFVVWGALHGFYLVVNHSWRALCTRLGFQPRGLLWTASCWLITFLAVVVAWVYFRAPSLTTANAILISMLSPGNVTLQPELAKLSAWLLCAVLLAIALILPNTQQFMASFRPGWEFRSNGAFGEWWRWRPTSAWALYVGSIGAAVVFASIWSTQTIREFLYFQF
ncbi:MBOAT family protein [Bosea sp. FBZP-16]|uniref:MBOAT family O-acyltransferase n=1 Tax=Bosea sp. FBZP-16 TaxID=2065382 RepID=UPI000C311F6C|nr:MBOAT family protein [Bosea sp. FBZP-16]